MKAVEPDISSGGAEKIQVENLVCPICREREFTYTSFPPGTFMWDVQKGDGVISYEVHNWTRGDLDNFCMECGAKWKAVYE